MLTVCETRCEGGKPLTRRGAGVERREPPAPYPEGRRHAPTVHRRPTLSAAIITLDEEENLPELLEQLGWVDEIVVVDGGSTDATVALARRYTDRVSAERFGNYAQQRNRAIANCRGDWVLFLDADERPGPGFVEEVRQRIEAPKQYAAFRVPIRSSIFGRRFRHSGTQDDRPVRLFERGRARWTGAVHEVARVDGPVGRLDAGLLHETLPTVRAFLVKMQRYTTLEANNRKQRGEPARLLDVVWRPPLEVFRRLVWKGGLLDGPAGWTFCVLSGVSRAVALLKSRPGSVGADGVERFVRRHEVFLNRLDRWVSLPHRGVSRPKFLANKKNEVVGCVEQAGTSWCVTPAKTASERENRSFAEQRLAQRTATDLPAARTLPLRRNEKALAAPKLRAVEQAVARRFDELAHRFHANVEVDDVRVRALGRYLGVLDGCRVLDLACGKGRYLGWLQKQGALAVGVDLAREMLRSGGRSEVVCAPAVRLPFRSASFDAVCAIEGFSHFPDPRGTLAEIARVLRPGGRFVLLDKNATSLDWRRPWLPGLAVKWIDEHRGRWMYPSGFVYRERWFWRPALVRLLRREFRPVVSEYLLSPLEARSAARVLFRWLPPLRHFMVIACDKR